MVRKAISNKKQSHKFNNTIPDDEEEDLLSIPYDEEEDFLNIPDDKEDILDEGEDIVDEEEDGLNIVDEEEDIPNLDTRQSISITENPQKKRGINKIQDLPVGESVKFNIQGAAIGEHQRKFTTYFGNSVRKNISILIPNWHKIEQKDKEMLWLDIKTKMRVEDDAEIKSHTLKSCGQKWRAFKNTLRNDYMLKNICPRATYTFLDPKVWQEFCRIERYTAEKLKKREEARARALKQVNRPRVGAKGYAGFEEQWEEERNDPNRSTDLHKIPGRGSNFCLGRRRLDKDGNITVPPETAEIAKKLVEADEQLSQGTIEAQPRADSLAVVYGPDHGGRTKGVSSIVEYKKGLTVYVRKKRTYQKSIDLEELCQQMQERFMTGPIWDHLKEKMLEELRKQPSAGPSSVSSTERNIIRIDCIKEATTCSLFFPESILTGERILCAQAMLYPVGDGLIHGKRLRKGHMRVSVFRVLNKQEDLELPVPDEDISKLGDALEAFIQWPVGAIARFVGLPNSPATSATAKSALPKNVQGRECSALTATTVPSVTRALLNSPATSVPAKSALPKNVQGPECSALTDTFVPSVTRASNKRKKIAKAPVQQ